MGYEWIQHKGKRILYVNYSECKDKDEMIALLDEMAEVFKQSGGNLLTIDDFTSAYASKEFMDHAKELGHVFSANRIKGAMLGIAGVKKILLQAYNLFAKEKLVPCGSKEEALEYLVRE